MSPGDYGMILTTLPDGETARRLASVVVEERLAACVQLCAIESFYRWEGRVANAPETLLIIKTQAGLFDPLMQRIKDLHPYSVPQIVAVPFTAGHAPYLNWIAQSTG